MNTQYINLNMVPAGVLPVMHVSQFDIGRPLGVVVYDGSAEIDLDSYTVTVEATRTDGTAITAAVTTDGNIGAFVTTATMTNKEDLYPAQLVIVDGDSNRVASLPFMMRVVEAAMDENSEAIEEDAPLYQQYNAALQSLIVAVRADLNAEVTARTNAVAAEESARIAADNTLLSNISAEASARAAQDGVLQAEIDQLVAPSGEAPSAAEVENARIGADGTVYDTLGNAIRGQVGDLKSAFDDVYSQVNTVTEYNADLYQNGFFDTNGAFNSSQNYKTSNPINVENASKISINKTYSASTISVIAFFDRSIMRPTTFISPAITSATDGVPVSVPSGAKYMNVSVANAYFDGLKITVIEDNIESNEKAIADANEAIADANEAIADINHNIGYPIITVTATTTAGWTEKKVAENINLEANVTYEFSISGTGTNRRYLRLADSNGTDLNVYNDTKDGSFEYTPTTNLTGCFLDYRSNISGATATISYRIKYPSILGDLDYLKSLGNPEIVIGSKLYAVVGDTVQIFFKSIIEGYTEDLIVKFSCDIGKNYPRYWEAVPVVGDVGNHTVTIEIYSNSGIRVTSKTTVLTVKAASNPQSAKNVLCIGDSTMQNGEIPIEASRRLKGTTGVATTPTALSLNNISFVGRKQNSDNTVGWEGTGGWTFVNYMTAGTDSVRFTVTGADNINIGAVYTINGFRLTIEEINVTSGSGNIRCTFAYKPSGSDWNSTSQTGTLTKYSGDGQNEIVFSAWVSESYQPFWNNNTDQFDIETYVDEYCSEQCDYICILLGFFVS